MSTAFLRKMKVANKPLVSIITVNFNGTTYTCDLLRSIKQLHFTNIEVIIVDNASDVDPSPELLSIYPTAKIILSDTNLGFAGGNNLGIKYSTGDFLFFVNNDTELTPGIIDILLEVFHIKPNTGIVCPKFHYYYNKGVIEYAGYRKMNYLTARNSMIGNKEVDTGQYNHLAETPYAHGGAMMVTRKVIDTVGLMPECYFLYYEELDWCEQIRLKGFKIYIQPAALIYHKESMTTGKNSLLKTYYLTRNRILFMRRNASGIQFSFFMIFFLFFTIPKTVFTHLIFGELPYIKEFYRGILWNFTNPSFSKI